MYVFKISDNGVTFFSVLFSNLWYSTVLFMEWEWLYVSGCFF